MGTMSDPVKLSCVPTARKHEVCEDGFIVRSRGPG